MSWNYRVVKKVNKIPILLKKNNPDLGDFDVFYEIHDVYLDESLDIVNIGRLSFPRGDDVESLQWSLERMMEACSKPVIDYNTGEEI
jgi:hypothetical protein